MTRKGIFSIKSVSAALLLLLAAGCKTEMDVNDTTGVTTNSFSVVFSNITDEGTINSYLSDIVFQVFNQDSTYKSVLPMANLGMNDSKVTYRGTLEEGTWHVVMATKRAELTTPVYGTSMSQMTMYTMASSETSCPEIFYELLEDVEITANDTTRESASMVRNMSRVFVRLTDKYEVVDQDNSVTIQLKEVPSTISWAGTILPDVSNPTTIDLNAQTLTSWSTDGSSQKYVEQEYILPAHRPSDFDQATPVDTLVHRMTIAVSYREASGGVSMSKEVVVPIVPRYNGQILYNLIPIGTKVEVTATLLDWDVADDQEETLSTASNFSCIVLPTNGAREVAIADVYKEWNLENGSKYDASNPMSQTEEVTAAVISEESSGLLSVSVVNRAGSWPHAMLKVQSAGVEGSGTVGIRLSSDTDYRWKWHVVVSDEATNCTVAGHENGMPQD